MERQKSSSTVDGRCGLTVASWPRLSSATLAYCGKRSRKNRTGRKGVRTYACSVKPDSIRSHGRSDRVSFYFTDGRRSDTWLTDGNLISLKENQRKTEKETEQLLVQIRIKRYKANPQIIQDWKERVNATFLRVNGGIL